MEDVVRKLRALWDASGETQREMGRKLKVPQPWISKAFATGKETKKFEPSALAKLADHFGVTLDYLCRPEMTDPFASRAVSEEAFFATQPEAARTVWSIVKRLGYEAAIDRLMGLPGLTGPPAQTALPGPTAAPKVYTAAAPLKKPDPKPDPAPKGKGGK